MIEPTTMKEEHLYITIPELCEKYSRKRRLSRTAKKLVSRLFGRSSSSSSIVSSSLQRTNSRRRPLPFFQRKSSKQIKDACERPSVNKTAEEGVKKFGVRFSPRAACYSTLSRSDYTMEERDQAWFSQTEFEDMMQTTDETVQKLLEDPDLMENGHGRGLEHLLFPDNGSRQLSLDIVLMAQHDARLSGRLAEFDISNDYRSMTSASRLQAAEMAIQDEKEAARS